MRVLQILYDREPGLQRFAGIIEEGLAVHRLNTEIVYLCPRPESSSVRKILPRSFRGAPHLATRF